FYSVGAPLYLHSFPTRRSSDLESAPKLVQRDPGIGNRGIGCPPLHAVHAQHGIEGGIAQESQLGSRLLGLPFVVVVQECDELSSDRKSTRLNSSHVKISYAVFC